MLLGKVAENICVWRCNGGGISVLLMMEIFKTTLYTSKHGIPTLTGSLNNLANGGLEPHIQHPISFVQDQVPKKEKQSQRKGNF